MRLSIERLKPWTAFWVGVASTLLGGAALLFMLTLACQSSDEYQIKQVLASPDQQHRAVLYTGMGGGAAGWCYQYLLIEPNSAPQPSARRVGAQTQDAVFHGNCGSDITLHWEDPANLLVRYTLDKYGISTYQRPASDDGRVRLTYEAAR